MGSSRLNHMLGDDASLINNMHSSILHIQQSKTRSVYSLDPKGAQSKNLELNFQNGCKSRLGIKTKAAANNISSGF